MVRRLSCFLVAYFGNTCRHSSFYHFHFSIFSFSNFISFISSYMFGLPDPLLLHHSISGHLLLSDHLVSFFFAIFIWDTWRPWFPPLHVVLGRCRVSILQVGIQVWHEFASIVSRVPGRSCSLGWVFETRGWCWFRPFCRKVRLHIRFPKRWPGRSCRTFRCRLAMKLLIVRL